jgi:hypothetical protein
MRLLRLSVSVGKSRNDSNAVRGNTMRLLRLSVSVGRARNDSNAVRGNTIRLLRLPVSAGRARNDIPVYSNISERDCFVCPSLWIGPQ